jgi:hypothetical protein
LNYKLQPVLWMVAIISVGCDTNINALEAIKYPLSPGKH